MKYVAPKENNLTLWASDDADSNLQITWQHQAMAKTNGKTINEGLEAFNRG